MAYFQSSAASKTHFRRRKKSCEAEAVGTRLDRGPSLMDEDLDEDLQRDHTLSLVLERLEKLAAQHSALITAHSELMAQHESVLKRLESYSFLPMDASNRDQYRASSPRTAPPPLQKPVSSHQSRASAIGKHGASSSSSAPSSSLSSSSTTPTVARILGEHRESSRSSMSEPRQQTRRPSMSTPRGRKVRSKEQAFSPLNQSLRHSDQRRGASIGRTTQTRMKVERSLVLKRPTSITAAKGNNLGGTEAATVTSTTFSSRERVPSLTFSCIGHELCSLLFRNAELFQILVR